MAQAKIAAATKTISSPRDFLEHLQVLIFYLQTYEPSEWPAEAGFTYEEAITAISNFLASSDPNIPSELRQLRLKLDDHQLQLVLAKLNYHINLLVRDLSKQPPSLPDDLKAKVEAYDQKIQEMNQNKLKRIYPKLDKSTLQVHQHLVQTISQQLEGPATPLNQQAAEKIAIDLETTLPQVGSTAFFDQAVSPDKFKDMLKSTVEVVTTKAGIPAPTEGKISVIAQQVHSDTAALAATPHQKPLPQEVKIPIVPPQKQQTYESAKAQFQQKVVSTITDSAIGKASKDQISSEELQKAISRELISRLRNQPPTALVSSYRQWLKHQEPAIQAALARRGISYPKGNEFEKIFTGVAEKTLSEAQKLVENTPWAIPVSVMANLEKNPQYQAKMTGSLILDIKNFFGRVKNQVTLSTAESLPLSAETADLLKVMVEEGITYKSLTNNLERLKDAGLKPTDAFYSELVGFRNQIYEIESKLRVGVSQLPEQQGYWAAGDVFLPGFATSGMVSRLHLTDKIIQFISGNKFVTLSHFNYFLYQNSVGKAINWFGKTKIGSSLLGRLLFKGGLQAATKVAIGAAGGAASGAAGATAGAAAGIIAGPLGMAISAILGFISEKVIKGLFKSAFNLLSSLTGITSQHLKQGLKYFLGGLLLSPIGFGVEIVTLIVIGTLIILPLFIIFLTAGAFIVPNKPAELAPPQEEYFTVKKTADKTDIDLIDPGEKETVSYQVSVNAKQEITITSVVDERSLNCTARVSLPPTPPTIPIPFPTPSKPLTEWTSDPYSLEFDEQYNDCRICNTVTVVASVADGPSGATVSDTVCVKIGNPPEDCPSCWPTAHGPMGQGPQTPDNDCATHAKMEAIDISVGLGTEVYATHHGYAKNGISSGRGKYVEISGSCSQDFSSYYFHLNSFAGSFPREVKAGELIGYSGNTGYSFGAHLHYELDGLTMNEPNIPCDNEGRIEACCDVCSSCGYTSKPCGVNWSSLCQQECPKQ